MASDEKTTVMPLTQSEVVDEVARLADWMTARQQAIAIISERDYLRARVAELESALREAVRWAEDGEGALPESVFDLWVNRARAALGEVGKGDK